MTFNEWKQIAEEIEPLLKQLQQVYRCHQLPTFPSLVIHRDYVDMSYHDMVTGEFYCSAGFDGNGLWHHDFTKSPTGRASE